MNNQKPSNRMHYGLPRMALACRGNTLAPVVIALFISALASIAFLQQGAQLSEKQKLIRAPEEVMGYIQEWVNLKKEKGGSTKYGGTPINPSELSFHRTKNIFGNYMSYGTGTPFSGRTFDYGTKSPQQCELLLPMIKKYKIIQVARCGHPVCGCPSRTLHIELRFD